MSCVFCLKGADVREHLRDRALGRLAGLQFDDDQRLTVVYRQDVDEAGLDPSFLPIVQDAKGGIELMDIPPEGVLHVSLQAEVVAPFADRALAPRATRV